MTDSLATSKIRDVKSEGVANPVAFENVKKNNFEFLVDEIRKMKILEILLLLKARMY